MARPTKFCIKCGEHVAEKDVYNSATDRFDRKLVHIDADGKTIYRAHTAVLDKR